MKSCLRPLPHCESLISPSRCFLAAGVADLSLHHHNVGNARKKEGSAFHYHRDDDYDCAAGGWDLFGRLKIKDVQKKSW